MISEEKKRFYYFKIVESASDLSVAIADLAEGEEREDLFRRQMAIVTQLMGIMGISLKTHFEDMLDEGMRKIEYLDTINPDKK